LAGAAPFIRNEETAKIARSTPSAKAAAPGSGDSHSFDGLLKLIYCGPYDTPPWKPFLLALEHELNVDAATLVLWQPTMGDEGVLISVDTDRVLEQAYRQGNYPDDPFLNIQPGYVYSLEDVIEPAALRRTAYYRELLAPDDCEHMMALDVIGDFRGEAKLRLARRKDNTAFTLAEKSFCARLAQHLAQAVSHYDRITVPALEHDVYAAALAQLSFGIVILKDDDRILCISRAAEKLVENVDTLNFADGYVQLGDPKLARKFATIVSGLRAGYRSDAERQVGALSLPGTDKQGSLQVIIRPIPLPEYHYPKGKIGMALFISSSHYRRELSKEVIGQAFGLSPAEAAVVLRLSKGLSIVECAAALGIAPSTARGQLRSIYSKTGVRRQSDLVALVLSSTASLA